MCYFLASFAFLFYPAEAVAERCSVKKVLLEISQNSQENACAIVSFLIKLQASGFFSIPFFVIVEVSFLHILYGSHEIKLNVMKYTLNCWNSLKEIFHTVSSTCTSWERSDKEFFFLFYVKDLLITGKNSWKTANSTSKSSTSNPLRVALLTRYGRKAGIALK